MSSAEKQAEQPTSTPEILAYIHDWSLKKQAEQLHSVEWDCVMTTGIHYAASDAAQNEWSDAAYSDNWDELFRIAMRAKYDFALGRFANSTRLRKGEPSAAWKPSGYTALHQAAWHGASVEVVQGLIDLGSSRGMRTIDNKRQRPLDIAQEKGYTHLYDILTSNRLPEVSEDELLNVQAHFHMVILEEARGIFKPDSMRLPDLGLLRDLQRVWMPIPGMYGGFNFWWCDGHLVTESFCRVCGGSGRTNHITADGAELVDSGWG